MPDRRVVISGLGVATPAGLGIGPFWQAVLEARSFIKPIDLFDASGFTCPLGGQLDNFSAVKFVPKDYRKAVKVMARDIQIAVAAADGMVLYAAWTPGGYGKMVEIAHGYGYSTRYGHCSRLRVTPGQRVRRGEVIAYLGSTGNATGPHCHYEIRLYGVPVSPRPFMK